MAPSVHSSRPQSPANTHNPHRHSPSGAGKTTLLNLLTGNAGGRIEGAVEVNGRPLKEVASRFKKLSTTVPQVRIEWLVVWSGSILVWSELALTHHPDPPTQELTNPQHKPQRQDDTLLSSLTPRETLTFAARLRLPMSLTGAEKRQRVAMYVFFVVFVAV